MGKKTVLFLALTLAVMAVLPAAAFGNLTNEYGLSFAGQAKCLECHSSAYSETVHGRFAQAALVPDAPDGWTVFKAAGDPPQVPGTFPIDWVSGGEYAIDQQWMTLGDYEGGAATEYLFWQGSADPMVTPWNLVEGLIYETPHDEWLVGSEAPEEGLYDVVYSCQRCHQLGATWPTADASDTSSVPNPAATIPATHTTAKQWAREVGTTVDDFGADPAVSYPGMSIQCERCHGTGAAGDPFRHGVANINMTLDTLGQSQVCGQCHGSFSNVAGTLGIYGYTPNLPMRTFVDISNYTYIPTEEEFLANPTSYYMFPNGSNARGNHFYYDEWAATAHSYRGAYYTTDPASMSPDAMPYQAAGNGHFNATSQSSIDNKCYQCHTGEGYLFSKDVKVAEDLVPTTSNVGFMGQECVTCHTPHPAGVGDEGNIREPDAAGERSAAGLAKGNDSVCEDCHNWQYEVQGTSPSVKPQASLSSRGGPSHPQRETVQGRVMLEVEAAGNFMPNVKCEDCHMPKTPRNANRYSHGMKPMLPGKADLWMTAAGSNYMGEDSCSKCHQESREDLQAYIDTWQDEATAAADAAAAAITAAQTGGFAEYSETDSTKPGYKLVGKATWNYKAFGSDGSTGAHNPEYIVAALEKAEQMAMSVGGSFAYTSGSTIAPGETGLVSGKVVNGDGSPADGAMLELMAGGVATGDTAKTTHNGGFTFVVAPASTTTYSVVWARSSDPMTDLTSAGIKVTVAKMASKTTIARSTKSMRLGARVKLTGKVGPADSGKTITVQARRGTGSWKTVGKVTLKSNSTYAKSYKPTARGTWSFRAKYPGSATAKASTSGVVKVTVR